MTSTRSSLKVLGALATLALANAVRGDVVLPTNNLPPQGLFSSTNSVSFGGGMFVLQNIRFYNFDLQAPPPAMGEFADYEFSGAFEYEISVSGGAFQHYSHTAHAAWQIFNVSAFGPKEPSVFELHSMGLETEGTGPFMIREDEDKPKQEPEGEITVQPLGNGIYHIDSFFDVFTELSLDGGRSWIPQDDDKPLHLELNDLPGPGPLSVLAIGMLGGRLRRRQS